MFDDVLVGPELGRDRLVAHLLGHGDAVGLDLTVGVVGAQLPPTAARCGAAAPPQPRRWKRGRLDLTRSWSNGKATLGRRQARWTAAGRRRPRVRRYAPRRQRGRGRSSPAMIAVSITTLASRPPRVRVSSATLRSSIHAAIRRTVASSSASPATISPVGGSPVCVHRHRRRAAVEEVDHRRVAQRQAG